MYAVCRTNAFYARNAFYRIFLGPSENKPLVSEYHAEINIQHFQF